MGAESFQALYPNLSRFRRLKAQIDPEHRFSSSQVRRWEIVGFA